MAKTPTWQRAEGKNPKGGLNEKGRASLRAAGHDIKRPQPEGGSRRDSFCARMKGMKEKLTSSETANDPDSRINKSLRAWNCHADGGAVDPYDAVQQASGLDRKKRDFGGFMGSPSVGQTPTQAAIQPNSVMQSSPIPQPQSAPQQAAQQPFNVQAMNTMAFMNPISGGLFGSPFGRPLSYSASPFASGMSPFGLMNTPETSFMNSQNPYLLNRQAFMPLMPQSSQSQQLPQGVDRNRLISLLGLIYGIGGMGPFMSYKDGGSVEPYDNVQKAAKGGEVWDKPRPKSLGEPEPLSSKQKASAKAAAKAAGRPYPNLVDNMRAARADGGEVWDRPRPKDLGEPKELGSKKKSKAKAMAKAAGRPYPNLIDNMRAARADGGELPFIPQDQESYDKFRAENEGATPVDRNQTTTPDQSPILGQTPPVAPVSVTEHGSDIPLYDSYRNILPTAPRVFAQSTVGGMTTPITEKDFSPQELDYMRDKILTKQKGNMYAESGLANDMNVTRQEFNADYNKSDSPYAYDIWKNENLQRLKSYENTRDRTSVDYDYQFHPKDNQSGFGPYAKGTGSPTEIGEQILTSPAFNVATTLGKYTAYDTPKGRIVLDNYNFNPWADNLSKELSTSDIVETPLKALRQYAGQKYADVNRPVAVNLDAKPNMNYQYTGPKITTPGSVRVEPITPNPKRHLAHGGVVNQAMDFVRKYKADGGKLEGDVQFLEDDPYGKVQQAAVPMMAREEYAQRMPVEEPVKYDTGPQPGEAVLRPYEPTIKERIYQGLAGTEERPTPERAQFARGVSELAEYTPVLGNVMAGEEAHRRGDTKGMLMAALPVPGMATEARMAEAVISPAEQAAQQAYQRVLNAQGLYSHGAEAAANLPQAKGTYEQMMAMLKKAGVKPEELKWSGIEKFEGQPVTREELSQHFQEKAPQIQETIYGAIPKDKYVKAEENLYNPEGFEDHPATYTVRDPNTSGAYTIAENHDMSGPSSWEVYTPTGSHIGMFDSLKEAELAANQSIGRIEPTRYGEYAIPGGENYREVVMHLPDRRMELSDAIGAAREERTRAATHYGQLPHTASDEEKQKALQEIKDKTAKEFQYRTELENLPNPYKSSHWEERNPLAHLRMSDRTGPEGEKILHLEELQSDWGQEGRKKGFIDTEKNRAYEIHMNELKKAEAESKQLMEIAAEKLGIQNPTYEQAIKVVPELENASSRQSKLYYTIPEKSEGLPTAPYIANTQNWTDLGLKRALKEAAEGGYDKMILTPGAEQAARYDLSQQIGSITARPTPDGKIRLEALTPDMGSVVHNGIYEPDKIDDLVGKEIADKIRNKIEYPKSFDDQGTPVELTGLDLKVGGEGMRSFYDKLVPAQLQKLVKKLDPDAKVELGAHKLGSGRYQVVLPNGRVLGDYMYPEQARAIARTKPDATVRQEREVNAHVINITPRLRKAILSGLPAYKHGGEVVNKPDPYDNVRKAAMISTRARRASY